jgi:hypothetical protein
VSTTFSCVAVLVSGHDFSRAAAIPSPLSF